MTETDRDPKLARRYRELGAEEPPRALDEAILAAARRQARPWTQRWAVPLSLAAVVVLSVTVTLRMQHEQPGIESPAVTKEAVRAPAAPAPVKPAPPVPEAAEVRKVPPPAKAPARARSEQPAVRDEPRPFARSAPEREERAADSARADLARAGESSASGAMAPRAAPAPAPAQLQSQARSKQADMGTLAKPAQQSPEQELERIAGLRREGKHDEADKALAEFRKRLPDYRIPPAMLERVERR